MLPLQFISAPTHIPYMWERRHQSTSIVELLVSVDLNIIKASNEPTFVMSSRQEVITVTLGTAKVGD